MMVEINLTNPYLISSLGTLLGVGLIFLIYQISSYMKLKRIKQKEINKELEYVKAKEILDKPIIKTVSKLASKKVKKEKVKPEVLEKITSALIDDKKFRELKPYNAIKFKFTDLKSWKDSYRNKFQADRVMLINMELLNGMNRLFLAKEKDGGFQYRKKQYIFDDDSKYYVLEAKLYAFDYHEGFVLPIKRKIPISSIRENIQKDQVSEIEYATNPDTLQNFMVAKIAEGIMKGAEIDAWMKQIRILLVIFGIISALHFFLYAQKSGVFAQLGV